jgi:hypothetical protein
MAFRKRPLSMKKVDVIRRMTAKDFVALGEEMDRRHEHISKICDFVKDFGKKVLTDEHREAFEREFGTDDVEDLDTALEHANWRLQPVLIKKLYKAASKSAKIRYKRGERE